MTAELGVMAAAVAFCLALLQALLPLGGAWRRQVAWQAAASPLAVAQFIFALLSLLLLIALFVRNDFSVQYVAGNSNTALSLPYRVAAVWSGHEGSLLLWTAMLAGWSAAVALMSRRMPLLLRAQITGILGLVAAGFWAFLLFAANPFARLLPAAAEGRDLNPLLQDPALAVHPPMLYMGYVGFAVAFAFAVAALLSGRMDAAWARWARPWVLAAWIFLTIGITLGSWWAYYELGWGGWWFWDPVENASFMPWLTGLALIHSLAATEARGVFKPWTALLAILTFSLCLLGAFLVRSGVLTSVHAFAADPARGVFILMLLLAASGGALALYGWRAPGLQGGNHAVLSRESGILVNNIFLTGAAFSVLLGTLYPLILEALNFGKISVGPPYFNTVFAPLAGAAALLSAVGALCRWKHDKARRLARQLGLPFAAAILFGGTLPLVAADYQWSAAAGLSLGLWVIFGAATAAWARRAHWQTFTGGFCGMLIAHAGVGVFVIGTTFVNVYEKSIDARLPMVHASEVNAVQNGLESTAELESTSELESTPQPASNNFSKTAVYLDGYAFTLLRVTQKEGDNYSSMVGEVEVRHNGKILSRVFPEKRRYHARPENIMTEAGIAAKWFGDIYVSLGEPLGDGTWSARLQIKPFVRWIWAGALLMALGGIIAAADKRYRRRADAKHAESITA